MGILLLPYMLLGNILCLMFHWSRRLARLRVDEESAHAQALQRRRKLAPDRSRRQRCEINRPATASIIGSGEAGVECHILKVSRECMRIAVALPIPLGEQINVEWENEFFVGAVCDSAVEDGRHVLGLQLISRNQA